ncbi:hypothetical protein PITC_065870 [Penicillium italicum]|uniref:Uncharacterized protein n=1 Tax=Penicillium italicum TaxID=40296 RepID=A0A0A2KVI7_PENIT|nr:hypothetical protein PITC_065870 [Penicillium italicum]
MPLGPPNLGRNVFSTFGFHLKALYYELLVIQPLALHINLGFRWHLFDRANGFFLPCPYFLSLSLYTTPCLSMLYLNCGFLSFVSAFLRFCTDVCNVSKCHVAL